MSDTEPPIVSIILPTYNRARFLPQAIESIRSQEFTDWELIIVDDGSTDETPHLLPQLTADIPQPVHIIRQDNQGAYAARNTGLDRIAGEYVAFFDSDDVWLPHHLQNCVDVLDAHSCVDWVYGATRIVDVPSGQTVSENCFYVNGNPRPLLTAGVSDSTGIVNHSGASAVRCQILHGLYCGLQASLIRRRLFADRRLPTGPVAEAIGDQLFVIDCLRSGSRLACIDDVQLEYHVHEANSSAAGGRHDLGRQRRVVEMTITGYQEILESNAKDESERQVLRQRLAREYFWHLGYGTLWVNDHKSEALAAFRRGIALWPWDWRYWKTYLACWCKSNLIRRTWNRSQSATSSCQTS